MRIGLCKMCLKSKQANKKLGNYHRIKHPPLKVVNMTKDQRETSMPLTLLLTILTMSLLLKRIMDPKLPTKYEERLLWKKDPTLSPSLNQSKNKSSNTCLMVDLVSIQMMYSLTGCFNISRSFNKDSQMIWIS